MKNNILSIKTEMMVGDSRGVGANVMDYNIFSPALPTPNI